VHTSSLDGLIQKIQHDSGTMSLMSDDAARGQMNRCYPAVWLRMREIQTAPVRLPRRVVREREGEYFQEVAHTMWQE